MQNTTNETAEKPSDDSEKNRDIDGDGDFAKKELIILSRRGYQYIKKGLYDKALVCFETILTHEQHNNYALVGIGDVLRKQGDNIEAIKYYQQCLEYNAENNFAIFGIADIMRKIGNHQGSIVYWKKYLKFDSKNIAILTRVADSYRHIDNFINSRMFYERALKIEKTNQYALIGLGWLYFDTRDYQNTLKYWLKVLVGKNNKIDIRVYTAIGNCYYKMRKHRDAIKYFSMAKDIEHTNFYVLFGLANCYRSLREYEMAIDYLQQILTFDADNRIVISRIGDAFLQLDDVATAKQHYRRALEINYDIFAVYGLARIDFMEGQYADALEKYTELLPFDQIKTRVQENLSHYLHDNSIPREYADKARTLL